jgi:hypothetical protein
MSNGVMIGIITAGNLDIRCVESLLATSQLAAASAICIQQAGPYLDMGRNKMVDTFRTDERYAHCDRLLFIDSDIGFDPALIQMLVDDDLPIVSGVYHSLFEQGIRPVVYEWTKNEDDLRVMTPINAWNRPAGDNLVPVDAVGAGFLMIHRNVFEKFLEVYTAPTAWFANDILDRVELGEDLGFCYRAQQLGIPVIVDRRVQVSHSKGIVLQGPYKES